MQNKIYISGPTNCPKLTRLFLGFVFDQSSSLNNVLTILNLVVVQPLTKTINQAGNHAETYN